MLNAVWVAVIVAVGFWVVLVCAAVYMLMRLTRLVSQTSEAVSDLRQRSEVLIERGHTAVGRAQEQLARTDAITASMDEVTADMAELSGRVAALVPLARLLTVSAGSPLGRLSALAYGVSRAVSMRRRASGTVLPAGGDQGGQAARVERGLPGRTVRRSLPARGERRGTAGEGARP